MTGRDETGIAETSGEVTGWGESSLYCFSNVRRPDQSAEMARLEAARLCLFCPDGLREHGFEVLHASATWSVVRNEFPYPGTRLHLLVTPRTHVRDLLDLDPAAQAGFWPALGWVRDEFGLSAYGLGVRNGDCRYTGATIAHVHAHVLAGDPEAEPEVPVKFRFSSRPG